MKKFLIYQYYYPDPYQNMVMKTSGNSYYEMSSKSVGRYSETIGVDYKYLDCKHPVSPFYGIFLPFTEEWCYQYDAICWMDSDILVTSKTANVFDFYDDESISAYHMKNTGTNWIENGHFNSGVVIWPKSTYKFVSEYVKNLELLHQKRGPLEKSLGDFDQAIVNKIIKEWKKYKKLPENMNYHLNINDASNRLNSDIIHYWRHTKSLMNLDFDDERILK